MKNIEWLKDILFDENVIKLFPNDIEKLHELINQLDEPEVLSQEWIGEHTWHNHYVKRPFVYVKDLQNLLVPKQEEVDQAYKDGYEKGKQHTTEKQPEETETVAGVLVDYLISSAKLKLALNMKVEELEE